MAKAAFLKALLNDTTVAGAARCVHVHRDTVYAWRKEDPEFAAAFECAQQESIELLESAVFERARKKSDTLAMFLLKKHKPEVYGNHPPTFVSPRLPMFNAATERPKEPQSAEHALVERVLKDVLGAQPVVEAQPIKTLKSGPSYGGRPNRVCAERDCSTTPLP